MQILYTWVVITIISCITSFSNSSYFSVLELWLCFLNYFQLLYGKANLIIFVYSQFKVSWAGFDKLELEKGTIRRVLLLGFSYGFQIWDVEAADNVRNIVSRHDRPVSFMQVLPKPVASNQSEDKFSESRPLLVICTDGSFSGDINAQEGSSPNNGSIQQCNGSTNGTFMPTVVWFYSFKSQSYVHLLRFRSVVHLVQCSSRVVAVLQSYQVCSCLPKLATPILLVFF